MFRFRGKRTDRDEWVTGWLGIYKSPFPNSPLIYNIKVMELNRDYDVYKESLSISTGKLDSTGTEIFASFPLDGVMTEGGDVLEDFGEYPFPVVYSKDHCGFILTSGGEYWSMLGDYRENALTITGKGGSNDN